MLVMEFEAPEEYVLDWQIELDELLDDAHVGVRQEQGHYPLIRVHVRSQEEESKFVEWLRHKIETKVQPSGMKIMRVEPQDEN